MHPGANSMNGAVLAFQMTDSALLAALAELRALQTQPRNARIPLIDQYGRQYAAACVRGGTGGHS